MRNTHNSGVLRRLHEALIDVVGFVNRPQNDVILLREAGVSLDRALFPLLVLIQRRGPLAVGELADRVGRDYTTVSRQVAKLEQLGLVARRAGKADRRVTEAVVTEKGQAISEMLDVARERLAGNALAGWSQHDLEDLARLLRRFADNLMHRLEGGERGRPTSVDSRDGCTHSFDGVATSVIYALPAFSPTPTCLGCHEALTVNRNHNRRVMARRRQVI